MNGKGATRIQTSRRHPSCPPSLTPNTLISGPDAQPGACTKRPAPTSCSASSSAYSPNSSTQPIANPYAPICSGTSKHPKRRRPSRAQPPAFATTHLLARDKAHFKSLVCQFTDKCTLDRIPFAPSSVSVPSSQPNTAPPSAPYPSSADFAIAQSLRSTLHALVACLQLLHRRSQTSSLASPTPEVYASEIDVSALLQELNQSQANKGLNMPVERPVNDLTNSLREPVGMNLPERSLYANLSSSLHPFLMETADGITAFSASKHAAGTVMCPPETAQHSWESEGADSQASNIHDQMSSFSEQCRKPERFLIEGLGYYDGVDDFLLRDPGLVSTPVSSQYDLLALS